MPAIDFSSFYYYPALQSTAPEHLGYRNLADADKAALLPIFELSQRGDAPDLTGSLDAIRGTAADRPFLLDLCKEPAPAPFVSQTPRDPVADRERVRAQREAQASYNTLLAGLLNPSDGFAAWRDLVMRFPNAVPVLQYTDAAVQSRQILRQAALLAQTDKCLAIRVALDCDISISSTVAQIISIISAPEQLLVILDCGQGLPAS